LRPSSDPQLPTKILRISFCPVRLTVTNI
jgi:hypothetical protein